MVPADRFTEIPDRKRDEDRKGDDLLDRLQLGGAEIAVADPVGRHLEAIFQQGDGPARQDDHEHWRRLELQMAVPGEGHEDVGQQQQADGGQWNGHGAPEDVGQNDSILCVAASSSSERVTPPKTRWRSGPCVKPPETTMSAPRSRAAAARAAPISPSTGSISSAPAC